MPPVKLREIRIELIIATLALCASAAASIATVVQTRVVGNQLSASVWPYLSFDSTVEPGQLRLSIDNDGLGPAIVRDTRLTIDGRPFTSWRPALKSLQQHAYLGEKKIRSRTRVVSLSESDIDVGTVVRPGASHTIIDLRDPAIDTISGTRIQEHVDINVCYCSTLSQCWTVEMSQRNQAPAEVGACPVHGSSLVY